MTVAHLYWLAAAGFAASTPLTLLARRLDTRRLDGEDVWSKPAKFGISLALHYATFAMVSAFSQDSLLLSTVAWLSVGAGVVELGYIAVQAGRQRRSHFNQDTRIEAAIYAVMGIGALLVLLPAVVIGAVAALSPPAAWAPAVRFAVPASLLIGTALTLLVTLTMGRRNSRYVGDAPAVPQTMWLTGWTLNAADLRPAHFVGTHIMQGVPVIALVACWTVAPTMALVGTIVAAAGWTWLTIWLFRRAVGGRWLPGYLAAFAVPSAPRAQDMVVST